MTSLEEKARHIRQLILTALTEAGSGHTGGSLDLVDIFTVLYFDHLRHHPQQKTIPDPYYGGDSDFELVIELLEDALAELLRSVER